MKIEEILNWISIFISAFVQPGLKVQTPSGAASSAPISSPATAIHRSMHSGRRQGPKFEGSATIGDWPAVIVILPIVLLVNQVSICFNCETSQLSGTSLPTRQFKQLHEPTPLDSRLLWRRAKHIIGLDRNCCPYINEPIQTNIVDQIIVLRETDPDRIFVQPSIVSVSPACFGRCLLHSLGDPWELLLYGLRARGRFLLLY